MVTDKVIIVTGAGSGIGRATSLILAAAGAKIIAADLNGASARETEALVREAGGVARSVAVNVADEQQVKAMVDFAAESFGRLDGAFNNAGIQMHNKQVDELESGEWGKVIDVNLNGVFYCMKYEIQLMRKTGGGAIVNTSSAFGVVGNPLSIEYIAAKHGVIGATRGASCDTKTTGVRVNAVLPGAILTPMVSQLSENPDFKAYFDAVSERLTVNRMGQPEDVGYAVKWLLSDESSYINGTAIPVDGGYTSR